MGSIAVRVRSLVGDGGSGCVEFVVARGRMRLSGCLLSVCLLLAGCTDPEPSPTPTPSPSSSSMVVSPSPSESSSAPPRAETPVEFIKRWMRLDEAMQNTGEKEAFLKVSGNCEPCQRLASRVDGIYSNGGEVSTTGWSLKEVLRIAGTSQRPVIDARVIAAPTTYRE